MLFLHLTKLSDPVSAAFARFAGGEFARYLGASEDLAVTI